MRAVYVRRNEQPGPRPGRTALCGARAWRGVVAGGGGAGPASDHAAEPPRRELAAGAGQRAAERQAAVEPLRSASPAPCYTGQGTAAEAEREATVVWPDQAGASSKTKLGEPHLLVVTVAAKGVSGRAGPCRAF